MPELLFNKVKNALDSCLLDIFAIEVLRDDAIKRSTIVVDVPYEDPDSLSNVRGIATLHGLSDTFLNLQEIIQARLRSLPSMLHESDKPVMIAGCKVVFVVSQRAGLFYVVIVREIVVERLERFRYRLAILGYLLYHVAPNL